MLNKDEALQQIQKEFDTASEAKKVGNDGKVRVCARRAAGIAITIWLRTNSRAGWGTNAMSQLQCLALDPTMPPEVCEAAMRLTAKITSQFTSPFSTHPIDDSKIIIKHLMEQK